MRVSVRVRACVRVVSKYSFARPLAKVKILNSFVLAAIWLWSPPAAKRVTPIGDAYLSASVNEEPTSCMSGGNSSPFPIK
eukprot:1375638-Amphidinium_carterae.1